MADSALPRRRRSAAVPSPKGLASSKIVVHGNEGIKIAGCVRIQKPAHALYAFCRDTENLTRVIEQPVTITARSSIESHWLVCAAPGERPAQWDALIINEAADRLIAWRSRETSELLHAGTVRFEDAPDDEGTEVTVTVDYVPPGGKTGGMATKSSQEVAGQHLEKTLHRFKALMEAGELG